MTAADGLRCRGWRQEAILRLLENNLAIASVMMFGWVIEPPSMWSRVKATGPRSRPLATASGADLVALHAGGGGYTGFSQSAGLTVVATGTEDAAARLRGAQNSDTALAVLRHADAGYADAQDAAREYGLELEA